LRINSTFRSVFFILTLVFIQSSNLFADAGLAFRFKIELQNEDQKLIGYVYHYTYSNGYQKEKESFSDYFLREFNNRPYLYKEVHSLSLSNNLELDFFLQKNRYKFKKQEITNLKLLETKELTVGERIFSIENKEVYNLIGKTAFNSEVIYYPWMENCCFYVIDFDKKQDIKKIKSNLDSLIKKYFNEKSQEINEGFFQVFKKKRETLLSQNVLILQYCDQL
jgi:hypothetical protein